jgi:hypothetical protein
LATTRDGLLAEIDRLKDAPIVSLVTPRAIAIPLKEKRGANGEQLFNVLLWVEVPAVRKPDIVSVEYHFPSTWFIQKTHVSHEASNSFAVSYEGWGCEAHVSETIITRNGQRLGPLDFDLCKALGWQT